MTNRETWALSYLRHRRAMIAEELTWIKARVEKGHDPDDADDQIVDALAGELSEVSALIQAFDARVLH